MIDIFEMTLGNMLPDKFYPIVGIITLIDIKTDKIVAYGKCKIPKYESFLDNNYIYIPEDFKFIDLNNKENVITINAADIPTKFKYQIEAVVDDENFNRMIILGLCKPDPTMSFVIDEPITFKVIPVVGYDDNNTKICDLRVWKETE